MTDITELAQSLKAAITEATPGGWYVDYDFDVCTEGCGFIAETHGNNLVHNAQYIALANPANILALVKALEKAQQENTAGVAGMAESYETTISMLKSRTVELESEVEKWKQESETWEQVAEKQLATAIELESRTVKLPDFRHEHFNSNWGEHDAEAYQVALREALTAQGIKWEAGRCAAMLQAAPVCTCPSGDGSLRWPCPVHPGNSPVIPGWIPVSEHLPDPKSEQRVCVYTPTPHEDMRYRFVPASLFRAVCSDATHWYYMEPPAAPQEVPDGK